MERYARFRPLTQTSRDDVRDALKHLGESLIVAKERTRIHLRLLEGTRPTAWTVETNAKSVKVHDKPVGVPKLEVVTRAQTWAEISRGTLSPLEAFIAGKLRVRGDFDLAKRMLKQLCEPDGKLEIC